MFKEVMNQQPKQSGIKQLKSFAQPSMKSILLKVKAKLTLNYQQKRIHFIHKKYSIP